MPTYRKSKARPQVLTSTPDIDMMGMEMRLRGTYMAGINLTQPIYTGGKIASGNRLPASAKRAPKNNNE